MFAFLVWSCYETDKVNFSIALWKKIKTFIYFLVFQLYSRCVWQWFIWNRKLRDQDRDLDTTSRLRLHQKFRNRDWKFETETRLANLWILAKIFIKILRSLLSWSFSILWHFSDLLWLFLPAIQQTKIILIYRSFAKPFLCNVQSLKAISCDQDL